MKWILTACMLAALSVSATAQDTDDKAPDEPDAAPKEDSTDAPATPEHWTHADFGESPDTRGVYRGRGRITDKLPVKDSALTMLTGRSAHKNSIAFDRTAPGARRGINASFAMTLSGQNEGFCFALLHTGRFNDQGAMWDPQPSRKTLPDEMKTPDWEEPNLVGTLAVGFDVRDPKDEDWFNENGNFYGRSERQVSLHFDGREIVNRAIETDMNSGEVVTYRVSVQFVTGGVEVSVTVGDEAAYDRHFLPHVMPYESRVGIGARGKGQGALDSLLVQYSDETVSAPAPISINAIDRSWVKPGTTTVEHDTDLLPTGVDFGRVILTLTYSQPMQRDYWDRNAAVYAWDDQGNKIEIARVITPFMVWRGDYRYDIDATLFAPLLVGKRKLAVHAGANVGRGFLMSVSFTYYRNMKGAPALAQTVGITNLWNGSANFQKPEEVKAFFDTREVTFPEGASRAIIRIVVTGHGIMEFTSVTRSLTVNGTKHDNTLWKTDCWLNPYRHQFGTWKFDRAGWGPGMNVDPWMVDVTRPESGTLELTYTPEEYKAESWATHWVSAQVIFLK